jgi:hypothetical protein
LCNVLHSFNQDFDGEVIAIRECEEKHKQFNPGNEYFMFHKWKVGPALLGLFNQQGELKSLLPMMHSPMGNRVLANEPWRVDTGRSNGVPLGVYLRLHKLPMQNAPACPVSLSLAAPVTRKPGESRLRVTVHLKNVSRNAITIFCPSDFLKLAAMSDAYFDFYQEPRDAFWGKIKVPKVEKPYSLQQDFRSLKPGEVVEFTDIDVGSFFLDGLPAGRSSLRLHLRLHRDAYQIIAKSEYSNPVACSAAPYQKIDAWKGYLLSNIIRLERPGLPDEVSVDF